MNPTNKSKIAKSQQTTDNIHQDFYNRAFAILAYMYSSGPAVDYILPKPSQTNQNEGLPEESKPAFQSRIVDLRLRRYQDTNDDVYMESNQKYMDSYADIQNLLQDEMEDITPVFTPEQADRPETPLYVRNYIHEQKMNQRKYRRRKPHMEMDYKKIEKEYSERIKKAQEIGIKRAEERYNTYALNPYPEFYKSKRFPSPQPPKKSYNYPRRDDY